MTNSRKYIGFRLPLADENRLEFEAKQQGISVNELARSIVLAHGKDTRLTDLTLEVGALRDELQSFRNDFSKALRTILLTQGKEMSVSKEEVEEWMEEQLSHVA